MAEPLEGVDRIQPRHQRCDRFGDESLDFPVTVPACHPSCCTNLYTSAQITSANIAAKTVKGYDCAQDRSEQERQGCIPWVVGPTVCWNRICSGKQEYAASRRLHSRWKSSLGHGSCSAQRSRICSGHQSRVTALREV